ncbi:ribonuclease P protein component [Gordonia sp. HY442]|uniref:ribonuclease P protein component n=1 Tax=Gordonia zhenghanii TaxID=2911516 RepID=UPI001F01D8F1|nr:ribonuclease P protein component [Gordonia zhenghanii]MCF8603738.1 ribonuclease P protein component [Gordonia zhenghanii]
MTAASRRISRRSDFTRTLSKGVRVSARDLVIHLAPVGATWPDQSGIRADVACVGGPWLGLIVSKKVGDAVTRHRVARRLRHAFAEVRDELPVAETFVVLRAYPSIAQRSADELAEQLREGFTHRKAQTAFSRARTDHKRSPRLVDEVL